MIVKIIFLLFLLHPGEKPFYLPLHQWPVFTACEIAKPQISHCNPDESLDRMPQGIKGTPDDPVSTLGNGDSKPGTPGICLFLTDHAGHKKPILKIHSLLKKTNLPRRETSPDLDEVCLRNLMPGMLETLCKIPVVCQYKKPFRIVIESPDRIDPLLYVAQEIRHDRSPLGILQARHITRGFMEHQVEFFNPGRNEPAVDSDFIPPGVCLRSELGDDFTVYADPAFPDVLLRRPAGYDASPGDNFLKSILQRSVYSCNSWNSRSVGSSARSFKLKTSRNRFVVP